MVQRRLAAFVTVLAGAGMIAFTFMPWLRFNPPRDQAGQPPVVQNGWVANGGYQPGFWTVVIGVVLILCGIAMWFSSGSNRLAVDTGSISSVVGLALVVFAAVFPGVGFGLKEIAHHPYAGGELTLQWGLWLTFACAIVAIFTTIGTGLTVWAPPSEADAHGAGTAGTAVNAKGTAA